MPAGFNLISTVHFNCRGIGMWKRIRNIRHLSVIGLLALAACGGDDGGTGSAVSLGAANNPAGTAAPTKATGNPGT
ncbi:hypothetical protein, partial [Burkholderia glumae]|uniref:hypothetical protein n=1 Tax=Burkholderia glumae TaxID=337 RepID=UPI0012D3348D